MFLSKMYKQNSKVSSHDLPLRHIDFLSPPLSLAEDSVLVEERLCCIRPSLSKLQLLAFAHTLYHANANDTCVVFRSGCLACPRVVQSRAAQVARNIRHMILQ